MFWLASAGCSSSSAFFRRRSLADLANPPFQGEGRWPGKPRIGRAAAKARPPDRCSKPRWQQPRRPPHAARAGWAGCRSRWLAALVAAGLWGAWVTKSVLADDDMPPIAKVQLSGIVGEYVQAQARSATPPEQVTAETRAFMAEIQRNLEARGQAGQIVLVGEAVLAGNVPDITAERAREVYARVRCRSQLPPRGPTSWARCARRWRAARRKAHRWGCGQCCQLRRQASPRPNAWPNGGQSAPIAGTDAALAGDRRPRGGARGEFVAGEWRDEHAILINTTESLPNWAFFIDKHRVPQRGDFVVFTPPQTPLITAHFGKVSPPFAKRVYGMPGDRGDPRGQCGADQRRRSRAPQASTSRGEPLAPGPHRPNPRALLLSRHGAQGRARQPLCRHRLRLRGPDHRHRGFAML
jgi:hypothetical protein